MTRKLVKNYTSSVLFTADGSIRVPHDEKMDATSSLTICARVKSRQKADGCWRRILDKGNGDTIYELTTSNTANGSIPKMRVWIGGSEKNALANNALKIADWVDIVGRYDGSEVSIWIDGIKQTNVTAATGNIDISTDDLYIAASVDGSNAAERWNGGISDVRIYTRALTDAEILNLHNNIEPTTNNLVGWWKLEELVGTTVNDYSGNNLNGTRTNGSISTTDVPMKKRSAIS